MGGCVKQESIAFKRSSLTRASSHQCEGNLVDARVYKVTLKYLLQPLRSQMQSFRNLRPLRKIPPFVRPNINSGGEVEFPNSFWG